MPRKSVLLPRKPRLVTRSISLPRKFAGFLNDGKVHVVLDTNVVIYALEALYKGVGATQIEKDSLEIIRLIEDDKIVPGVNIVLFNEYRKVINRKVTEGQVTSFDASYLIKLLEGKSVYPRMNVDKERFSHHIKDDILFDGLSTAYLVSNNFDHVDPTKLFKPSIYQNTLTPSNFLVDLRRQKVI